MYLALKEMRRAWVRFCLLTAAIGLLVFLILFQQALQSGLVTSFVGAIRNQSAPVLVYSVDGQRVLQGSVITPDLERIVRATPGIAEIGYIGQGTFTVTADSEPADATIIGYEREGVGSPRYLTAGRLADEPGEAVASEADADKGFDIGNTIVVEPGGLELTVVGLAPNAQLSVTPTLFVGYDTFLDAVDARNPGGGDPLPNALAVVPSDGTTPAEVVTAINAGSDAIEALTREQAADRSPGVAQVRQSFQIIFLLYGLVVPLVTGLFFLIVTIQKAGSLTLLRAIGAPAGRLVSALLVQVLIIVGLGLLLGTALYYPLTIFGVTSLALRFDGGVVVVWSALLMALSLASSLLAARRVLAIDPLLATTGAGVGR
ncbi:MAG TPA: ABC transporter permease [Ilumatobacter sp.]|jgi:putative ABC transport system permease protein|nr:ABC transporter permease [Ilumatobacter sp.]